MQNAPLPLTQDLVLIGGGHAHALVMRMWGMNPLPGVRLTVINPGPVAPYTGMLPGHIAGHYTRAEMMIDLVPLARFAGARVILDRAIGLDRVNRRVLLAGRAPIAYNIASLDIGIGSDLPEIPGFAEHAVAAKPLGAYADRWQAFVDCALPAPKVVVIGAGIGGVELALASSQRLRQNGITPQITLLEQSNAALPHIGKGARAALLTHLTAHGITLVTNASPARISQDAVILHDGQSLPADFILSVAGSRPQSWLEDQGLDLKDGFLDVGPSLQTSDPTIFATGDCAHLRHAPRPKAGVFAVRQAPILFHNLRAMLSGSTRLRRFHPQHDYLKLVSTGGKGAVADKFGLRLDGRWLWRWKDHIDRSFMEKFADYPRMPAPPLPKPAAIGLADALGSKPLCGGCGAKVGAGDLAQALATLPAPRRADVASGPGDDAAVLRLPTGFQVMTTDHLRAFVDDPGLMAHLTAIHALGDIWAMGATPQVALAQITLPRLGHRQQTETLREIMAAASAVFAKAGADIVGGHTSVGAELTIGFTVTGLADRIIAKSGARPGDAILLTKPIGTGTILAAEMARVAPQDLMLGEAVAATFASMTTPLDSAAAILAPLAHAMTDVTGFGLAGHLLEILNASACAATLDLAATPILPGARSLAEQGIRSSIMPANRTACLPQMHFTAKTSATTDLLFDPQTGGGLLATLPAEHVKTTLSALHDRGVFACQIGTVTKGPPALTIT